MTAKSTRKRAKVAPTSITFMDAKLPDGTFTFRPYTGSCFLDATFPLPEEKVVKLIVDSLDDVQVMDGPVITVVLQGQTHRFMQEDHSSLASFEIIVGQAGGQPMGHLVVHGRHT